MIRSVSIIIPAYNEAQRLPATLDRVLKYLLERHLDFWEVVVVDDGSSDTTAEVATHCQARHPEVRLLRNPGNRGKGYSVRHGMLQARAEWVLFSDADLSAPIEDLDLLAQAAVREPAPVVIGSRALDRSLIGVRQSAFRENAGRFFNVIMRALTGLPFRDTQCGFKLFQADAARQIFGRQQLDGFGFDVEVLVIARRLGYRTAEIPVRWNNVEGTKVGMLRGLDSFVDLVRIRWYQLIGRYDRESEGALEPPTATSSR